VKNAPRVRWLEFLFMPLALAIIVVAWFNPAVAWLLRATTGPDRLVAAPSPLWMVGVIIASAFVTRSVLTHRIRHPRLLIVGGGLAAMIATAAVSYRGSSLLMYGQDLMDWGELISPELVVLIAAAALWWRGILIGRSQSLVEENLERTFFNGVIALALLLYFNHLTGWLSTSDLMLAVLTFFGASLAALMIVNIERARLLRSDQGFQFNRHWVGTLVGVIGAILLGAVALAGIFSPQTLREFGDSLRPAIGAIGGALLSIFMFIADIIWRLMEPLVPIIKAAVEFLFNLFERVLQWLDSLGLNVNSAALESIETFLNSPGFQIAVRGALTAVVLIAIFVAVIWAIYRSGLLSRRNFEETRESIASRALLIDQLKHLLNRLRRKREIDRGMYLPLNGNDPRRAVRQAYQEFLEWARIRIRARAPYQTPSLYAQRLGSLSEAQQEPVGRLTALYLRARYGRDEITPDDAQSAQSALVRLQELPVIQSPLPEE
jgi:hypothetical protein